MSDTSSTNGSFFADIYRIVKAIPKGRVATYGQVAVLSGHPRAARYVGFALHSNPEPSIIPCHRVVFRDGSLSTGYAFGGPDRQRQLLEEEGVIFKPSSHSVNAGAPGWVVNLEKSAWRA